MQPDNCAPRPEEARAAAPTEYELICPRCLTAFPADGSALVGTPCSTCAPLFASSPTAACTDEDCIQLGHDLVPCTECESTHTWHRSGCSMPKAQCPSAAASPPSPAPQRYECKRCWWYGMATTMADAQQQHWQANVECTKAASYSSVELASALAAGERSPTLEKLARDRIAQLEYDVTHDAGTPETIRQRNLLELHNWRAALAPGHPEVNRGNG